ncbi:MAG: response regulator transcription factor [Kiritimatiellae bacterium]|nr:response regulator transcription factor [Kiritimatiellia bacterium]
MKPRLLLADDHQIVLNGLKNTLEHEFELVGTATDGRALVDMALRLQPDLIMADISMPLLNGIDAVIKLRQAGIPAKIVILTMHADPIYAAKAFEAGAIGYVIKHAAAAELVTALHEALRGHTYLSPEIDSNLEQPSSSRTPMEASLQLGRLSGRQREVLQLLAEGKSAKEIGAILKISSRTVEFHKYRIMEILKLRTTAELVGYAIRDGQI